MVDLFMTIVSPDEEEEEESEQMYVERFLKVRDMLQQKVREKRKREEESSIRNKKRCIEVEEELSKSQGYQREIHRCLTQINQLLGSKAKLESRARRDLKEELGEDE